MAEFNPPREDPPPPKPDPKPIKDKPLYRDSLPLGAEISKLTLPKLISSGEKSPPYKINPTTHRIANGEAMNLISANDDPNRPNVAVMDNTAPAPEGFSLNWNGNGYNVHSSHFRQVIDALPQGVELRAAYSIGAEGKPTKIDVEKIRSALLDLVKNFERENIRYINCSFSAMMTYPELKKIVSDYGPENYNGTLTPKSLRDEQPVIAGALRKYFATDKGKADYSRILEVAQLFQQLIDRGVVVLASAGNSGELSFDPIHILVPDIIVVAGSSGGAIDKNSTDHSLVDTSQPYRGHGTDKSRKSGTSFATPSSLAVINLIMRDRERSIGELNDALRADLEVRIRKKPDTIPLAITAIMIPSYLELLEKKGMPTSEQIETMKKTLFAFSPQDFAGVRYVLEALQKFPHVPGSDVKALLKALDRNLNSEAISSQDFHKVFEKFAAIPTESRKNKLDGITSIDQTVEQFLTALGAK